MGTPSSPEGSGRPPAGAVLWEPAPPASPANGWMDAVCKPGSGPCIWAAVGAGLIAVYFEICTGEWAQLISVAA